MESLSKRKLGWGDWQSLAHTSSVPLDTKSGCTMTLEYLSSQLLKGRSKSGSHYKEVTILGLFRKLSGKRDENTVMDETP